jgi:hypothetical protein
MHDDRDKMAGAASLAPYTVINKGKFVLPGRLAVDLQGNVYASGCAESRESMRALREI